MNKNTFFYLSLFTTVLTFCVVILGAYVRLSDAGLGCPDWPFCYGHLGVPMSAQEIAQADASYPQRPVEVAKAWKEMVHRYLASTLGLLIVLLAALAWRNRQQVGQPVKLPLALVAIVIFQGLLGMWTVTLLLKPAVVTAHLLGGMATLGLIWWLTLRVRGPRWPLALQITPAVRYWSYAALVILIGQIFLGGWTSTHYAALACADNFPTCQGQWLPPVRFEQAFVFWHGTGINYEGGILPLAERTAIHLTHRLGAVLTLLVVGGLALYLLQHHTGSRSVRQLAGLVLALLALQIALGIANVVYLLPLPLAVAHNGGAALLLLALITLVQGLQEDTAQEENLP